MTEREKKEYAVEITYLMLDGDGPKRMDVFVEDETADEKTIKEKARADFERRKPQASFVEARIRRS